jgi:ABC-type spermidine/putrescine transport system permease subunit I
VTTTAGAIRGRLASREWPRWLDRAGPPLLLAPTLLLLFVFFVYPLAVVLSRSFTDPSFGLENYTALWESRAFRAVMRNTFVIAAWTTVISLVLAYPVAYKLATLPARWARLLLLLTLVPLFTAILARLYAWTILLGNQGMVNDVLVATGITDSPVDLLFTRTAVVVGMVHVMLPYMILVLYSTMVGIDRSLLDAARSLGASRLQTFRRVFLPLSMPGVYAGCLLVFILSLGFFITPAVLGGPGDLTIATFVQQEVAILKWGAATAMSVVLVLVTLVLFVVFDRLFGAERLLTGGVRK